MVARSIAIRGFNQKHAEGAVGGACHKYNGECVRGNGNARQDSQGTNKMSVWSKSPYRVVVECLDEVGCDRCVMGL